MPQKSPEKYIDIIGVFSFPAFAGGLKIATDSVFIPIEWVQFAKQMS